MLERVFGNALLQFVLVLTDFAQQCRNVEVLRRCRWIKNAIVDTFVTANSQDGVSTELSIKKPTGTRTFVLQVSTEKVGDLALVRIDRYKTSA